MLMKREIDPLSEVSQMLDSANSKIRRVYTMYTVINKLMQGSQMEMLLVSFNVGSVKDLIIIFKVVL